MGALKHVNAYHWYVQTCGEIGAKSSGGLAFLDLAVQ